MNEAKNIFKKKIQNKNDMLIEKRIEFIELNLTLFVHSLAHSSSMFISSFLNIKIFEYLDINAWLYTSHLIPCIT